MTPTSTIIISFLLGLIPSIILGVISFNQNKKLEALKSEQQKQQFVHKLQFEKEFEIYNQLWLKLLSLIESTATYIYEASKIDDGIVLGKLTLDVLQTSNEFQLFVLKNKPFFSKDIFKDVQQLEPLFISMSAIPYSKNVNQPVQYSLDMNEKAKKIQTICDKICESIRERITNAQHQ